MGVKVKRLREDGWLCSGGSSRLFPFLFLLVESLPAPILVPRIIVIIGGELVSRSFEGIADVRFAVPPDIDVDSRRDGESERLANLLQVQLVDIEYTLVRVVRIRLEI